MSIDRRHFLELAAAASVGAAVGARAATPKRDEYLLQVGGYPVNAETPLQLLTDYLTPNHLFFIRSHWIPRMPDLKTWRLSVEGEVRNPLKLSLRELRAMPSTEATCVLMCAGNGRGLQQPVVPGVQWKYGAAGNARWRGVRVADVLKAAGVKSGAAHLHLFGSDDPPEKVPPFHRSLELGKAMDDAILAYEMNGAALPAEHGAPLRLVVPGWAGDHWMKWVVRMSVQPEPAKGFYMETAYKWPLNPGAPGVSFKPEEMRPVTELSVKSNITTAPAKTKRGAAHTIRGFAFSGAPGIERVELSDDDGATWSPAGLDPRQAPFSWRLWSFRWTAPRAGTVRLLARATDSRGATQPRQTVWNQSGYLYNAWHAVDVEVSA
jgi:DMSO/TMAO reductase YedYZ molybdopterin-dependent catalytic subunit